MCVSAIVSLWKLYVAMETTLLIQSTLKPMQSIPLPNNGSQKIDQDSEVFVFEIVDGRRTMRAFPIITCEPLAQIAKIMTPWKVDHSWTKIWKTCLIKVTV